MLVEAASLGLGQPALEVVGHELNVLLTGQIVGWH
jgi:hypothetical protein